MGLADVAAKITGGVPAGTCATCHALSGMSEKDAATLRGLLADRGVKFRTLADALAADPDSPSVPWESLSRHARAGCAAKESLR